MAVETAEFLILGTAPASSHQSTSTATKEAPQAGQRALTNQDVLDMLGAGLSAWIGAAKIKTSKCALDTSPGALKALKAASVPDGVILAMVGAAAPPVADLTISAKQNPCTWLIKALI